jgi:hypothetical protein
MMVFSERFPFKNFMIVFLVNEKRTRLTWDAYGNDSSEISFYNRGVFSTRELADQSIERYTQQSRSFKFFSIFETEEFELDE